MVCMKSAIYAIFIQASFDLYFYLFLPFKSDHLIFITERMYN